MNDFTKYIRMTMAVSVFIGFVFLMYGHYQFLARIIGSVELSARVFKENDVLVSMEKPVSQNAEEASKTTTVNLNSVSHTTIKASLKGIFGEQGYIAHIRKERLCDYPFQAMVKCGNLTEIIQKNISYRMNLSAEVNINVLLAKMPDLQLGGRFMPQHCRPCQVLAIIVPYRAWEKQLKVLFRNLHQLLRYQQLAYQIFVLEQVAGETFNKGKLLNVGFLESRKLSGCPVDCIVMHDIDKIPEGPGPYYACSDNPKELAWKSEAFKFKMPYETFMGGVTNTLVSVYEAINGYSNLFWGWGGEDDDYFRRVSQYGKNDIKPDEPIGRFFNLKTTSKALNGCRFKLLDAGSSGRLENDGLNNMQYTVHRRVYYPLYTWILVELGEADSRKYISDQKICK